MKVDKKMEVVPSDEADKLIPQEIESRKKILAARANRIKVTRHDPDEKVKDQKVRKPRLPSVIPDRIKKGTGDWVADVMAQHDKDQKAATKTESKRPYYIKADTEVSQKQLMAQWAFPVRRLEEFLSLFRDRAYDIAVRRLECVDAASKSEVGNHPEDARRFVEAMRLAMEAKLLGYRSLPNYCEIGYYFWIIRGIVCFGCELPGTERMAGLDCNCRDGFRWVKGSPMEIIKERIRLGVHCPEGAVPVYTTLLSFMPGKLIGVMELARRMVKNPQERIWVIRHVLRMNSTHRKMERIGMPMKTDWEGRGNEKAKLAGII